jgi:LysM repeat protein
VPARVYVVRSGDTLWGIARRVAGPTADPRPVIARFVEANDLRGATIQPGQRLVLPGS